MSLTSNNIKNLLQNQNISLENLQNKLKENNTDQATLDQVTLLFNSLDKNKDGTISKDEWEKADELLAEADKDDNGEISDTELNATQDGNMFKQAGSKVTNTFLKAMSSVQQNAESPCLEAISGGGGGLPVLNMTAAAI